MSPPMHMSIFHMGCLYAKRQILHDPRMARVIGNGYLTSKSYICHKVPEDNSVITPEGPNPSDEGIILWVRWTWLPI